MDKINAYLAKVQEALDMAVESKDYYEDPETKARYIRTPEGAARFGGNIGDLITADMVPQSVSRTTVRRAVAASSSRNTPRRVDIMQMDDAEREAVGRRVLERNERRTRNNPGLTDEADTPKPLVHVDRRDNAKIDYAYEQRGKPNGMTKQQYSDIVTLVRTNKAEWVKGSEPGSVTLVEKGKRQPLITITDSGKIVSYRRLRDKAREHDRSPEARKTRINRAYDLAETAMMYVGGEDSIFTVQDGFGGPPRIEGVLNDGSNRAFMLEFDSDARTFSTELVDKYGDPLAEGRQNAPASELTSVGLAKLFSEVMDKAPKTTFGRRRGAKWADLDLETKVAISVLEQAGTHEWVEDPEHDGVLGFVEAGSMKAEAVMYEDGTVDIDAEFKTRYVRDPDYWGVPYMTPIVPGMKPQGPTAGSVTGPKG
jgi:hypothetical protein